MEQSAERELKMTQMDEVMEMVAAIKPNISPLENDHHIFVDGLKYSAHILAMAKFNIELALNKAHKSSTKEVVQGRTSSRSYSGDSGIQIDIEDTSIQKQTIENDRQENRMVTISDSWSTEERELFENGIKIHGKNFGTIAKSVQTKTVQECVKFYYDTKKMVKYKQMANLKSLQKNLKSKSRKILAPRIQRPAERKSERIQQQQPKVKQVQDDQKENENQIGQQEKMQRKNQKRKKEGEKFEVDYIFGRKQNGEGKLEYRVFWKGYTRADATWEPAENLKECAEAIDSYEREWGHMT